MMSTRISRSTLALVVLSMIGGAAHAQTMQQLSVDISNLVRDAVPSIVSVSASRSVPSDDHLMSAFSRAFNTTGTGFVVEPGYVLTSYTVVANAKDVDVTFPDGATVKGKLAGKDPLTNTALVKIDKKTDGKPLALGDSASVKPGTLVVSVSNRRGTTNSVALGVVSTTDARMPDLPTNVLQISGEVGPGASGGPVFDPSGKVVGMTVAMLGTSLDEMPWVGSDAPAAASKTPEKAPKASKATGASKTCTLRMGAPRTANLEISAPRLSLSGGGIGKRIVVGYNGPASVSGDTGYAIPIDTIKDVLTALKSGKEIEHGYVGILLSAKDNALRVDDVEPDSPADKAGVKFGDTIVSGNDRAFAGYSEFSDYVLGLKPGSTLKLKVKRDAKEVNLNVIIGKRPEPVETADMGSAMQEMHKRLRELRGDMDGLDGRDLVPDLAMPFSVWTSRPQERTEGVLVLRDAGIEQVAQGLMDAYKVNVIVSNPAKITGKVSIRLSSKKVKVDDALSSICTALGCKYEKKGETYILSAK